MGEVVALLAPSALARGAVLDVGVAPRLASLEVNIVRRALPACHLWVVPLAEVAALALAEAAVRRVVAPVLAPLHPHVARRAGLARRVAERASLACAGDRDSAQKSGP